MSGETYVVRNTARRKGRFISMTPENTSLKALSCGRIILDPEVSEVSVDSRGREVALICLRGEGVVNIDSTMYRMKPYDALYVPVNARYRVSTDTEFDLAESSAPSNKEVDPHFVSFDEVKNEPTLHVRVGKETYCREIYKLIDANIDASRLLCGVTFGKPGNWTSWLPHEHARSKEEVYLFIDMPDPAFGIQMMYTDNGEFDFVERVFEDDAVIVTKGYHPNVGIPGFGINFVWMMAALRPEIDRDWTDMNFQKEFEGRY